MWIHPNIVVRIISKRLGEKYYRKKVLTTIIGLALSYGLFECPLNFKLMVKMIMPGPNTGCCDGRPLHDYS